MLDPAMKGSGVTSSLGASAETALSFEEVTVEDVDALRARVTALSDHVHLTKCNGLDAISAASMVAGLPILQRGLEALERVAQQGSSSTHAR